MNKFFAKLPRILKEPTGWVLMLMVAGFIYVQWPTHVRQTEEISYVWQTLDSGFAVAWEEQPKLQSEAHPQVWGLSRKGMSFLVQTDELDEPFDRLVKKIAEQDRKLVGGAVQMPLVLDEASASYSFFDAESRIQEHHWFLKDNNWVKVSVLYKPSSDTRKARAKAFLDSAGY